MTTVINRNYLQDKTETEKVDVELEERKFEPSVVDKDLVEILGNITIAMIIIWKSNKR